MDKLKEEVLGRPFYVYDLPPELLATLYLSDEATAELISHEQTHDSRLPDAPVTNNKKVESNTGSKACSLCNLTFATIEDQRSHVRSDLHEYNLKQKLRGAQPVSEEEFENLVGSLNESLSGSDSTDTDDEEDERQKDTVLTSLLRKQATLSSNGGQDDSSIAQRTRARGTGNAPIVWLKSSSLPTNTNLGIYRAIFTNAEQESKASLLDNLRKKQINEISHVRNTGNDGTLPSSNNIGSHIFLCMIGGGHFAAMVVSLTPRSKTSGKVSLSREATVLAHKTFHRYTTRRKQGGSQSSNDSAKGPAHSVGSSLRRSMEVALTEEVRALLADWKGLIDSSQLLFVRATGSTNRRTLFGPYEGQVLKQNDARLRTFPFSTRRATQNELMRSFIELTRVKVREVEENVVANISDHRETSSSVKSSKVGKPSSTVTSPKPSEEEELALLHTTQIQALIRRSKLPALLAYLQNNNIPPEFIFYPKETQQNHHAPTMLHLAASLNSPALVSGLLTKGGANPTISNEDGKAPFDLAGDRATRDAFRVARSQLDENVWDWASAHVPSALSQLEAEARSQQEKQEVQQKEADRRNMEAERLKLDGHKVPTESVIGKAAERGRARALGAMQKTAQEKREEESKGLTPGMRMQLERERRARAAEERIRRLQGS